jgi:proteasome accessory factor C
MPKVEANGEELFNLAISIVGLVMREAVVSKGDLAKHFGVSERSIERAVRAISLAEDGRRFLSFFELDWDAWDDGEISLRPLGELRAPPPLSRAQSSALATAIEYLASLPEFTGNEAVLQLREALQSVPVAKLPDREARSQVLTDLRDAIGANRLEISYLNQIGEASRREVDPIRIDLVDNRHYLRAWCHQTRASRNFRVDRIVDLRVLGEPISKEARDLELADNPFEGGNEPHAVVIEAAPTGREIFWNFPVVEGPAQLPDGNLRGVIKIADLRALGRHVARYGGAVRVIEPQAARAAVRSFAEQALRESEVE